MKTIVSVILPIKNGSEYLHTAILSVLSQSYNNLELLIVLDSPTTDASKFINNLHDSRVRILPVCFSNISRSLNYGIINSIGELIARIDDDDLYDRNKLEKQVAEFEKDPTLTMLTTDYTVMDAEGKTLYIKNLDSSQKNLTIALSAFNPICHSSVMIRKSHVMKHDLFYDEEKNGVEDFELWQRMLLKGLKINNISEPLTFYRKHFAQVTAVTEKMIEKQIFRLCDYYVQRLDENQVLSEKEIRFSKFLNYYYNGNPFNAFNLLLPNLISSILKDRRYVRYVFPTVIKLFLPIQVRKRLLNYLSLAIKKNFHKDYHKVGIKESL